MNEMEKYLEDFLPYHIEGNLLRDINSFFVGCTRVDTPKWYSLKDGKAREYEHLHQAAANKADFYVLEQKGSGGKSVALVRIVFLSADLKPVNYIHIDGWAIGDVGSQHYILAGPDNKAWKMKTDYIGGFGRILGELRSYMGAGSIDKRV